ncbi:hypothetical protein AB0M28_13455 [Streptomyces sp. NPDC051940]|uniref:hypothetical protein n=1 Tax=Streptomyces sp. NPDC051940 TaxID=3155675 RepID=UPI0034455DB0
MPNKYKIEAPVRSFTGESVGVHFHKGTGYVDTDTKEGRAALEYFRRHGYGVAEADDVTEEERVQELVTGVPAQRDPQVFDPAQHDAPAVIAYLDEHADDEVEVARVLDAERNGKARKTVLARGEQQTKESDPS